MSHQQSAPISPRPVRIEPEVSFFAVAAPRVAIRRALRSWRQWDQHAVTARLGDLETLIQHQLWQLPQDWDAERQHLADRLTRLLLLRVAHARIFADAAALADTDEILADMERLWRGEAATTLGMRPWRVDFAQLW